MRKVMGVFLAFLGLQRVSTLKADTITREAGFHFGDLDFFAIPQREWEPFFLSSFQDGADNEVLYYLSDIGHRVLNCKVL